MQAAGHAHDTTDMSITPSQFMSSDAVFGIDLEKIGMEATFTGLSTRDGKVLNLTVKNSRAAAGTDAREVFVFQVYDGIVNIRRGAVGIEE